VGECSRCGTALEPDAAWCGECGLALKATSGLPTPEAREAAAREHRWLEEHKGTTGWAQPPPPPPRPEQPERSSSPGPPPRPEWALRPRPELYKPIALRAHILRWWLVAGIFVNGAVTVLNAIHLNVLDVDNFAGGDAVVASDERLVAGGAALLATFVVSTILWLLWFHRAYRNVESFGSVDERYSSRWAVGAWFVPIANLFVPKQIANDIWRGTDRQPHPGFAEPPVAPLVHWWWAAWLVANLLGNLSFRLIDDARTLDAERTAVAVDIAAGISFVVAGVLALRFVRAVTEREAACAAALHGAEADAERVRTAREGRGRRRVATVAFTVVGAAALVASVAVAAGSLSDSERDATGEVTERSTVSAFEVRRGDCLNGLDEATEIRVVEVVPCDRAHQAEVLSGFRLPDGSYPGLPAVVSEAERRCGARLVAAAPPRRNGPEPFFLYPTRQSWALGDRIITCIATFKVPMRGALSDRRRQ
jgi:Domain of unknown function (DUF4328)/Septum formation